MNANTKHLLRTFNTFGGAPGSLLSRFLGRKKTKTFQSSFAETHPQAISDNNSPVKALKENGFFVIGDYLNSKVVDELVDFSLRTEGDYRKQDSGIGEKRKVTYSRHSPESVRFEYHASKVLESTKVQDILSDERLLSLAQDYLGATPILDFVTMWWHTKSHTPDKNAAQYFHFDMDRLRWLKFFFYLTDVGELNGPHVFIPGTHKDFGIPFRLRRRGYVRYEDSEIRRSFPESQWKTFTGSKGTLIAEDTRGLHKGAHVIEGDRLVLQFQFTSALYGQAEVSDQMSINSHNLSPILAQAMHKFPYVFQRITLE